MGRVIVLGGGESGVGAALLARKLGKKVFLSDAGQVKAQYKSLLKENEIPFEEGGHTKESFFDAEIVIKSPGIPPWVPLVQKFVSQGIEVISEIEYAFRNVDTSIIALTGSNGKTTTTSLVHHLLISEGVNAYLGGNIGKSFALQVATLPKPDVYVLEISSFQLDDCVDFRPDIGVLLNITPDHLDRYNGSMEAYAASKFRINMNQTKEDVFIYNGEDPWTLSMYNKIQADKGFKPRLETFGLKPGGNAWTNLESLFLDDGNSFSKSSLRILGPHNFLNALAALLAVRAYGKLGKARGLSTFQPIAHRLEPVGKFGGVSFINDSKATNVDAVKYALQAVNTPIVWMAGGVDKGNDYKELKNLVEEKVKAIVVLGENDEKFHKEFQKPVYQVNTMKAGVVQAKKLASKGDSVLLSPACASFDLFKNYEDRGNQFKDEVLSNQK